MWFLIRHGETLHNLKKIRQGHYPSMLTLKGIDQIKSISYRMAFLEKSFENYKLTSSPMVRTRQTMQIILEILNLTNKKIIETELLSDMDAGLLENVSKKEIEVSYPNIVASKKEDYWNTKFPEAESPNDVYKRTVNFYETYKNEENLIIVSHGLNIRFLNHLLLGKKQEEYREDRVNQNYFYVWNNNIIEKC